MKFTKWNNPSKKQHHRKPTGFYSFCNDKTLSQIQAEAAEIRKGPEKSAN